MWYIVMRGRKMCANANVNKKKRKRKQTRPTQLRVDVAKSAQIQGSLP